ncbi:MAG: hypothetical protein PHQ52_02360 [Candidatus Omnitrophica bacterium]|nr:hypothetical protein [Candidatus Omnitrophota bacterium]
MKKYCTPRIASVELDGRQAVLQVCKIGGVYFDVGYHACFAGNTTGAGFACTVTPKGGEGSPTMWVDPLLYSIGS